jgi:hypothetical protein
MVDAIIFKYLQRWVRRAVPKSRGCSLCRTPHCRTPRRFKGQQLLGYVVAAPWATSPTPDVRRRERARKCWKRPSTSGQPSPLSAYSKASRHNPTPRNDPTSKCSRASATSDQRPEFAHWARRTIRPRHVPLTGSQERQDQHAERTTLLRLRSFMPRTSTRRLSHQLFDAEIHDEIPRRRNSTSS